MTDLPYPNQVIVGQVHGHPGKSNDVGETKGMVTNMEQLRLKPSSNDFEIAETLKIRVYAVDYSAIRVALPSVESDFLIMQMSDSQNIPLDALKAYSGCNN